jgi:hypothetical protein
VPLRPRCDPGSIDTSWRGDDEGARADGPGRPAPLAPDPAREPLPPTAVTVHPESGTVHGVAVVRGDGAGRGRRVLLRFVWRPADPLAVSIDVEARPDHPALPRGTWIVLRDFLRYGLMAPTGDGDVQIHPGEEASTVWLTLARRTRPCRLAVPAAMLSAFLDRTEEAVPCGEERSDREVDDLIAALLER